MLASLWGEYFSKSASLHDLDFMWLDHMHNVETTMHRVHP